MLLIAGHNATYCTSPIFRYQRVARGIIGANDVFISPEQKTKAKQMKFISTIQISILKSDHPSTPLIPQAFAPAIFPSGPSIFFGNKDRIILPLITEVLFIPAISWVAVIAVWISSECNKLYLYLLDRGRPVPIQTTWLEFSKTRHIFPEY